MPPPVAVRLMLVVVQVSTVVPVLLVMPAVGGVQTPGTVVTVLVGLEVLVSASQLHRVRTVIAVL